MGLQRFARVGPPPGSLKRRRRVGPGVGRTFADVDPRVRALLAQQGIERLYPPQEAALDAALGGRNLVLSIPTASGKSLVAYLALLHRYIQGKGKGLYIVPLRALASEKYDELRAFRPLGLKVGFATGDLDDEDPKLGRYDVIVATSEKADSLLRHRAPWMSDVKTVVADEVHLLTDGGRGPTLEVLLTRLRSMQPDLQLLGLSATVQNAKQLAKWLDADLVESDWRPTPLKKGVAYGRGIDFLGDGQRPIVADTKDAVADLVLDILDEKGQALVFLSTRRSAEALARSLGAKVRTRLSPEDKGRLAALARAVSDDEAFAEFPDAAPPETAELADARPPKDTLGGRLAHAIAQGVAFHNAGLSARQRRLVEQQFRAGLIKVLTATPTLAAGVNTPARRVVIRDWHRYDANFGNQPLPVMEVLQMMGRAGRPRYDAYGEAVLVAKDHDDREALIETYLKGEPEPITSKLGAEPALRVHILATIASNFARTTHDVEEFLDRTFYAHQGEAWLIKAQVQQVLRFLEDNEFIVRRDDRLEPTGFGKRTSDLYIDPLSALILRQAIERASKRDATATFAYLHALAATPELDPLFLRAKDDWVLEKVAQVEDGLLFAPHEAISHEDFLSRIKTANLLEDWIEETPLDAIERRYNVGPGDVRNKVDRAEWLAHAARELARLFHYETATALNNLPLRLRQGARSELLPLLELDGVGRVRARTLYREGYTGLAKLREARVDALARLPGFGPVLAARVKEQVGSEPAAKEVGLGEFGA
jgi:helicase